jgi:hypothetical protein
MYVIFILTRLVPVYQVSASIFQNFPVSAKLEDTGHCQNMSIADSRRFWEILIIPVLQILEDSGKY